MSAKRYDPAKAAWGLWQSGLDERTDFLRAIEKALRNAYAAGQAACRVTFEARPPRSPRGTTPPSGER